jgi:hypothetical protein
MHEVELLMVWRRNQWSNKFLHFCKEQVSSENDDEIWEGCVKKVMTTLAETDKYMRL